MMANLGCQLHGLEKYLADQCGKLLGMSARISSETIQFKSSMETIQFKSSMHLECGYTILRDNGPDGTKGEKKKSFNLDSRDTK